MAYTHEQMRIRRERKVRDAMGQWAPIWLVHEEFRPREDSLVFNLVYQHPIYGWVNHRFKHDAFNDVLYHMGQKQIKEEETLQLQEQDPYIFGEVSTRVPNDPAQRLSPPVPSIGQS
jgi:hypothetical protein